MSLQWSMVSLLSREIICDLPSVEPTDPLRRTIGQYQSVAATLTVTDKTDPAWARVIDDTAGVGLIAYSGAPGQEVIKWGGIVVNAPRSLTNQIPLSLVTLEGYLDRRYCGNYTATNQDQNYIVADVVNQFAGDAGGLPITVQIIGDAGKLRTRTYADTDDKTVYSILQDLMGVDGGPEWSMHWEWDRSGTTPKVWPVLYVGTRLGTAVMPGLAPAVTFETDKLISASVGSDWTGQNGANVVTAVSSGQGGARPTSGPISANDPGRPKYEYRYTPSTSITNTATLVAAAQRALGNLKNGSRPLALSVPAELPGFTLGVDWDLGDDVGVNITGPCFPTPLTGHARCIGYEVSNQAVTPILAGGNLIT